MSMSITRRRAALTLVAAGAVAAAVLALAAPAGASTGTKEISPEQAGYTATGAQFMLISAQVYLRNPAQYAGSVASMGHSVQLWSSDTVAIVGVTASTTGSGYTPYATIYNRSTHAVIASDPHVLWCVSDSECDPTPGSFRVGETVEMWLNYSPETGLLVFEAWNASSPWGDKLPSFQSVYNTIGAGQSYNQARVGTDFGSTPWDASYSHTPPAKSLKAAAYSNVSLTSYSGHTAPLWSWWVHHKLLANTNQQSGSDWVAVPSNLTSGGESFQTWFVPQSAQGPHQPTSP